MIIQYRGQTQNIYIVAIVSGLSGLLCIFICIYVSVTITWICDMVISIITYYCILILKSLKQCVINFPFITTFQFSLFPWGNHTQFSLYTLSESFNVPMTTHVSCLDCKVHIFSPLRRVSKARLTYWVCYTQ